MSVSKCITVNMYCQYYNTYVLNMYCQYYNALINIVSIIKHYNSSCRILWVLGFKIFCLYLYSLSLSRSCVLCWLVNTQADLEANYVLYFSQISLPSHYQLQQISGLWNSVWIYSTNTLCSGLSPISDEQQTVILKN